MTLASPDAPHRRFNPLTGRWVLVSPQRSNRPWLGEVERVPRPNPPAHDPGCHLCPGVRRASGIVNPAYSGVWVFENDFPALESGQRSPPSPTQSDALFGFEAMSGTCRVICFSPDHGRALPDLAADEVRAVVDCWAEQSAELGAQYPWVQIFENKGAAMGSSNPHPHGQVWASSSIPDEPATEDQTQRAYLGQHGRPMLRDLADREAQGPRLVFSNRDWLVIVPWWASWPFETLLLPRHAVTRLEQLDDTQRDNLAEALRRLVRGYDALFDCPFPYSMGWHGAPYTVGDQGHWQLHAHFYPPLLRSATVRKFMVGYELLAGVQRDLTPEQAAERLRHALASQ